MVQAAPSGNTTIGFKRSQRAQSAAPGTAATRCRGTDASQHADALAFAASDGPHLGRSTPKATKKQTAAAHLTATSCPAKELKTHSDNTQLRTHQQQQQQRQRSASRQAKAAPLEQHHADKDRILPSLQTTAEEHPASDMDHDADNSVYGNRSQASAAPAHAERKASKHRLQSADQVQAPMSEAAHPDPFVPELQAAAKTTSADVASRPVTQQTETAADEPLPVSASDSVHQAAEAARHERVGVIQQAPETLTDQVVATQEVLPSNGKRLYTRSTPHPTLKGVMATPAGKHKKQALSRDRQLWSAVVHVAQPVRRNRATKPIYLGKHYWTPEAAARAVDRANIAVHGRDAADTNFPVEWYGSEVTQAHTMQATGFCCCS